MSEARAVRKLLKSPEECKEENCGNGNRAWKEVLMCLE